MRPLDLRSGWDKTLAKLREFWLVTGLVLIGLIVLVGYSLNSYYSGSTIKTAPKFVGQPVDEQQKMELYLKAGREMLAEAIRAASKVNDKAVRLEGRVDRIETQSLTAEQLEKLLNERVKQIIKEVREQIPIAELQKQTEDLKAAMVVQESTLQKVLNAVSIGSASAQPRPVVTLTPMPQPQVVAQQRLKELDDNCLVRNHPYTGKTPAEAMDALGRITDADQKASVAECRQARGQAAAEVTEAAETEPPYQVAAGQPMSRGTYPVPAAQGSRTCERIGSPSWHRTHPKPKRPGCMMVDRTPDDPCGGWWCPRSSASRLPPGFNVVGQ